MDVLNRSSFVLRLPAEVQAALGEAQNQIRRKAGADLIRWTPTQELTLTLLSLGEISIEQVARISGAIGPTISQNRPMRIVLEGLGGSPTNLQPRFLWIGVGGDTEALKHLAGALEQAIAPVLPGLERREFQPQVPIGRLKQESEANRSAVGRAVRVAGIGEICSFPVTQVELVRAAVTSVGVTTVTVQAFPLLG